MYLIFTDESGTNKDSNIVLYGGIAIGENNLIKSEMIISDIAKEFFGIDNMLEIEIYFVDIFNYVFYNRLPSKKRNKNKFEEKILPLLDQIKLDKEKLSLFVIELFQFLGKVNATFLVSVLKRNNNINTEGYVFKNFLNLTDTFLNKKNSYGILIADGFFNQNKKRQSIEIFSTELNIDDLSKEYLFKRILFEGISWRQKIEITDSFPLKWKFESKIYNIFSSVLFMPSDESHLIQISDVLLYVLKKYIEYKMYNIKTLVEFFNEDFQKTFNYLLNKECIAIATLTEDKDTLNTDIFSLLEVLRQVG
ncbi:DUF3800 domain-containing protein [Nautilia sp.]